MTIPDKNSDLLREFEESSKEQGVGSYLLGIIVDENGETKWKSIKLGAEFNVTE